MRSLSFIDAFLLAGALLIPAAGEAQEDPFTLTLLRTQLGNGATFVDAVAEIDPLRLRTDAGCAYVVQITITDAGENLIAQENWPRSVPCPARNDTTLRFVDTFSFLMGRGVHTVEMIVLPGGERTGRMVRREAVEPLPQRARTSDLYLAREIAWDTTSQEWPMRKGGIALAIEAIVDIPIDRPLLGYYLELYNVPQNATPGSVQAVIRRTRSNRDLVTFTLHEFDAVTASRPLAGTISIAGLPEGEYEMITILRTEGTPDVRHSRPFRVRPARPTPATVDAPASGDAVSRYFAGLQDEELARFDPVVLWMTSAAARESFEAMNTTGKRVFLAEFFRSAQVPGGMADGDPLRVFLARAAEVERQFGPRQEEGRAGWRTDRGRLWIRYGEPADRIRRPFPVADSRPYEIWYYDVGTGYVYLFVDEHGFEDYRLLYSTDPTEPTVPGWSARAGIAAVEELDTYYGIELPQN